MTNLAALHGRGLIILEGEGRSGFLQGLVSNDVTQVSPGRAVWTAFLTPQGKYLADFFIIAHDDTWLLDCEAAQIDMLITRLSRFRLRSKVTLRQATELSVYVAWGAEPPVQGIVAADPRLPNAGWRVVSDMPLAANATQIDWDHHRIRLGLPDGTRDLEPEKTVLLEAGFDELGGVSWQKGCYLGQELTARTKYRGLVKRRLVPVTVEGALPSPGSPVLQSGVEVGTMRSGVEQAGMALLRLGALSAQLECAGAILTPHIPAWMRGSGAGVMTETRAIDWEARYRDGATGWERPGLHPAFVDWLEKGAIAPCRILVPGGGRSLEPLALAEAGFDVTVVDLAESAVAAQRARLARLQVNARIVHADLMKWEPPAPFGTTANKFQNVSVGQ